MNMKQARTLWDLAFAQVCWVAFIVLKITHALPISWWWCLVPVAGCLASGYRFSVESRKQK